jgi:hypothetical protein
MTEPRLCSDAARLRGDDNAATAARVDLWLLVEFAGTWGRNPIRDAALPDDVREALAHATSVLPRSRLVFIRRRLVANNGCRVYLARSTPKPALATADLASVAELATFSFTALLEQLAPAEKPLILVCTHGQHDSCCGKRGYPLYDALRCNDALDVWQCSHIGGDRFAANALVLPWGLYYGPVEAADAQTFASTVLRDEIYLSGFRGRSTFGRAVQAAETFVRRESGLLARDAFRVVERQDLGDGRTRVQLRDRSERIHDITLELYVSAAAAQGTCTSQVPAPIRQFRVVDYHLAT